MHIYSGIRPIQSFVNSYSLSMLVYFISISWTRANYILLKQYYENSLVIFYSIVICLAQNDFQ